MDPLFISVIVLISKSKRSINFVKIQGCGSIFMKLKNHFISETPSSSMFAFIWVDIIYHIPVVYSRFMLASLVGNNFVWAKSFD